MPTRGADWPMQYETVRSWLHRMNKPGPARFHGWNYRATFKIYFDIMEYLHHLHHTHIHNSIISIHAYMSSYEMMDTWWHVVSACSLQNCQVAHGLIAQIEKEETHASGKIEKQKQPISLDSCHQMSRVCPVGIWQVDDIRTYLHSFAQRITAIQVEWYSLVNICWKRKTWNLKARESKWKCQCFQGCKEWSLRG